MVEKNHFKSLTSAAKSLTQQLFILVALANLLIQYQDFEGFAIELFSVFHSSQRMMRQFQKMSHSQYEKLSNTQNLED